MENREIKFRAWDKKDKEMYYDIQKGIEFTDLSHYTFDEFLGYPEGMGDYHKWEVMQYTGLKDKNGKEIYEGDIWGEERVGKTEEATGVVKFDKDMLAYIVNQTNGGWIYLHEYTSKFNRIIIGNIYENKELLK